MATHVKLRSTAPVSAYPLIRLSAYPLIRLSAYPLIRLSAYPLIRLSAYPLIVKSTNVALLYLMKICKAIARSPLAAVLALLLIFGVFWIALLGTAAITPPMDNIEQTIWLRSLEWGYYKQPPLPTWLAAGAAALGGYSAWPTYILGAICTLTSLLMFWQLLRECRGTAFAHMALVATLCVTFYNGRLYYFNHNVVMMPFTVGMAWTCWRLTVRPRLSTWALLGLCAGLGMLSKYETAIAGGCVLLWWLHLRGWRHPVHKMGLWLGGAVVLLVLLPHVIWLTQHNFGPLHYAENSSLGVDLSLIARLKHTLLWLGDWLFNRPVLSWFVLGGAWWSQRHGNTLRISNGDPTSSHFLLLWGIAPALMMALLGFAFGTDLQLQWMTAYTAWTVAGVMTFIKIDWGAPRVMRVALSIFLVVQLALGTQMWLTSAYGPEKWHSTHWRNFPSDVLARGVAGPAQKALGGPIDIISGPYKEAGALALRLPGHPRVLISGDLAISPWIHADELSHDRVITLFRATTLPKNAHWAMPGWAWSIGITRPVQESKNR